MPLEKDFLSPIVLLSRAGTVGDPFIKKVESTKKIDINGMIQLEEIPAKFTKNYVITDTNGDAIQAVPVVVSILGSILTEVKEDTANVGYGQYRVDYENGLIFFNPQYYAGATADYVQYTGRGAYFISANRIYLGFAEDLSSLQTLETQIQDAYNLISTAGAYISPENRGGLAANISLSTILATANLKEWNYWIATNEIILTIDDATNSVIDFDNSIYTNGQTVTLKENSWLVRTVGNKFQVMKFGASDSSFTGDAVDVTYNNTISGLLATNVQAAIDEVNQKASDAESAAQTADGKADQAISDAEAAQNAAQQAQNDVDNHKLNNGSDHSFINQDVKDTARPGFNGVKYNTIGAPAHAEGQVWYDGKTLWLDVPPPGMRIPLGQGEFRYVRNESGATISALNVIYPTGSSQGLSTVALADATLEEKVKMIGVTIYDIPNNSNGWVITSGGISGIDTSAFGANDFLYVSDVVPGQLTTNRPTKGESYEVLVAKVRNSDPTNGAIGIFIRIEHTTEETHNVNGFPPDHQIDVNLAADDLTRTFSLTPDNPDSEFHFYVEGTKFKKYGVQSIQWPNVNGQHYFIYDANGDLQVLTNPTEDEVGEAFIGLCAIAFINWNADAQEVTAGIADERHGIDMPPSVHGYNHRFFGSQYLSGMGLSGYNIDGQGNSDADAQVIIGTGVFYDEDIRHELLQRSLTDQIMIFYNNGTVSEPHLRVKFAPAGYINTAFNGTGRAEYNRFQDGIGWDLAEVPNGDYVLAHVMATNFIDENNIQKRKYAVVMGQSTYTTKANARDGANTEIHNLNTVFPLPEFISIATFIIETANNKNNLTKSSFVSIEGGGDFVNWLTTSVPGGSGSSVSSHSVLLDRDALNSHPASAISLSAIPGMAATNVQEGFEEGYANLLNHIADETNPHKVDYTQTGAVGLAGTQTITGQKTFENQNTYFKDIHVENIFQLTGGVYQVDVQEVLSKNAMMTLRDGAVGALGVGEYTGLRAKLYDGVNDGLLVFDKDGIARVGDEGALVPLLGRDEQANLSDGDVLVWDAASLVAKGKTYSELAIKPQDLARSNGSGLVLDLTSDNTAGSDIWLRIGHISDNWWNLKYVGSTSGTDGNEFRIETPWTGRYWQFDHDGNFEYYDGTAIRTMFHSGNLTNVSQLNNDAGYAILASLNVANWDAAYGWGNHASAGYAMDNDISILRGSRRNYTSVDSDPGTDAWYNLFTITDSISMPIICNVRAYAHTGVTFVVSKGYQGGEGVVTILQSQSAAVNASYKWIKGVRMVDDGKVQIKLNAGATVSIDAQIMGSNSGVVLNSTLTREVGTPTVDDSVDLVNGMFRAPKDVYIENNIILPDTVDYGLTNTSKDAWLRVDDQWGNVHLKAKDTKGIYVDGETHRFRSQDGSTEHLLITQAGNSEFYGDISTASGLYIYNDYTNKDGIELKAEGAADNALITLAMWENSSKLYGARWYYDGSGNHLNLYMHDNNASGRLSMRINRAGGMTIYEDALFKSNLLTLESKDASSYSIFRIRSVDSSVQPEQILGDIQVYSDDADGAHIASYIRTRAKETYGRKAAIEFGVAITNSTDAVKVAEFNESGNFMLYHTLYFGDSLTYLAKGHDNRVRIGTDHGYADFGAQNNDWFHMSTDRGKFYMDDPLHVNGDIYVYNTTTRMASNGNIYELNKRVYSPNNVPKIEALHSTERIWYVSSTTGEQWFLLGQLNNANDGHISFEVFSNNDYGNVNQETIKGSFTYRSGSVSGYWSKERNGTISEDLEVRLEQIGADYFVYIRVPDYMHGIVHGHIRDGQGWAASGQLVGATAPTGNTTIYNTTNAATAILEISDIDGMEPSAPTGLSLTEYSDYVDITFDITAAKVKADTYEVWSSVGDQTSWEIIKRVNSDELGAATSVTVFDTTYTAKATVYYKVYAIRNGAKSTALTGNIALTQNALDVTNMEVVATSEAFYISFDVPNDARIVDIYIKKHAHSSTPVEGSAIEIYRGQGNSYVYIIPSGDKDLLHQFWVYVTTATS